MGVLVNAGVLTPDKKLTDRAFNAFIKDVKNKLATGNGIFPEDTECAQKTDPNAAANLLKLENKKKFPEFHARWRPVYENLAKSMDVEPAANLAKQTGQPAVDPTYIATAIGVNPPKLELAEAIASVVTPPTPPQLLELLGNEEGNSELLDPVKQPENLAKLAEALGAPPVPPLPILPDPIILELGYTEQFSYELEQAVAPIKTHTAMMLPAAVLEIPAALGNLPFGLVAAPCAEMQKHQPKSMEGATFEEAVSDVLKEHTTKFNVMAQLGQNIGSGVITNSLASTPFADGGLEMLVDLEEEEEEIEGDFEIFADMPLSARRRKVLEIINAVLGPPPEGKPAGGVYYPDPKFAEISNWKPGASATIELSLRAVGNKLIQKAKDDVKKAQKQNDKASEADANKNLESARAADRLLSAIADIGRNHRLSKPVVTTCGAFPPYILAKLGLTYEEGAVLIDKEFQDDGLVVVNILGGGLESLRISARALDCWVEGIYREENDETSRWTGQLPRPGDLYLLTNEKSIGGTSKYAYEYDLGSVHVGVIIDISGKYTNGDKTKWITADAGQGFDGERQGVKYVIRDVEQGPTQKGGPLIAVKGEIDTGGKRPTKILSGWVNIDKVKIKNEKT